MKASDFLKRLKEKGFFKEFMKENPDAYLCAIFCILNKEEKEGDKINLDFYVPSKKSIAYSEHPFQEMCFSKDGEKEMKKLTDIDNLKIDLEDLWIELERVKTEKKISQNTGKIIGVLTEDLWNLTCIGSALDLLRVKLNPKTKEIIDVKKNNLTDMVKIGKK